MGATDTEIISKFICGNRKYIDHGIRLCLNHDTPNLITWVPLWTYMVFSYIKPYLIIILVLKNSRAS